ncbi:hypothetical protein ElyMa_001154000 [Elysia marginata]|uniref:CX domain-containing protein n=1 Tax=Elysia marginata TaxID=1093978 RepID=A0AAV4I3N2_9GAST|nr:hypothetical protein ElyMa_001154000 [Elysia marginata]
MCVKSLSQGLNVDLQKTGLEPLTSRSESPRATILRSILILNTFLYLSARSLSSPTICLPMNDISYDPFGTRTDDVSEELRDGSFGRQTLYCKRGCCGDNRAPECCAPDDDVGQKTFETYKLITVIAAGVGGLAIIGVIVVAIVKWQMKKRRLIRDIEALNRTNRMTDLKTKVKGIGNSDGSKKKSKREKDGKKASVFTNSKKASVVHVRAAPFEPGPAQAPPPPPASYATLNPPALQNTESPSSRAAGGHFPVFLPTNPAQSFTAPVATAPPPKPEPSSFQQPLKIPSVRDEAAASVGSTPLVVPSVSDAFASPLARDPVVFSGGPINKGQNSTRRELPSTTTTTAPRKASIQSNMSETPPDIPWDDADLLLFFSDPHPRF